MKVQLELWQFEGNTCTRYYVVFRNGPSRSVEPQSGWLLVKWSALRSPDLDILLCGTVAG